MAPQGAEAFVHLAMAVARVIKACDMKIDLEGLLFCPPRAWGSGLGLSASQKNIQMGFAALQLHNDTVPLPTCTSGL